MKFLFKNRIFLLFFLSFIFPCVMNAQEDVNPDMQCFSEIDILLEPFNGNNNDFDLVVKTDKSIYYDQDLLHIILHSEIDCYFAVYHLDVDNKMQVIYPNRFESGTNFLKAGMDRVIPENTYYLLHAPFGEERILVYASNQPIDIREEEFSPKAITGEYLAAPDAIWNGGDGDRSFSENRKRATSQASYTIIPGGNNLY